MKKAILAAMLALPVGANATLMLCEGPAGCDIQGGSIENVLFPNVGDIGTQIIGTTNQTQTEVTFDSNGELMVVTGGGQAKLEAIDGGLDYVRIDALESDIGFEAMVFNVHANIDGVIDIVAWDNFGTAFNWLNIAASDNGQNWFTIDSDDVQYIDYVEIDGFGILGLEELQQVRVDPSTFPCVGDACGGGGGGGGATGVDAPANLALLSLGLVGLYASRRKASA